MAADRALFQPKDRPAAAARGPVVAGVAAVLLLTLVGLGRAADPAPAGDARPAAASAVPPAPPPATLLYFFSPDWRPSDLGRLAVAMEEALGRGGVPVTFQAFARYEDFERQLIENRPPFVIAPAWIGEPDAAPAGLRVRVIARPLRHGRNNYRKALMTRPGVDSIDDLARGSIAATLHSMSGGSAATVLEAFHLDSRSARVVAVPKDVDALLALSFGQVDGALVTAEQYDQLARSNAAEASRLHLLAFSPEIALPPLFATEAADPETVRRLRDLVVGLVQNPDGSGPLPLLGFDGFVAVPPTPTTVGPAAGDRPGGKRH